MTGSAVERIEAAVGPTSGSPAKKSASAPTVETSAMAASQPSPAGLTSAGRSSPVAAAPARERRRRAGADQRGERERAEPLRRRARTTRTYAA